MGKIPLFCLYVEAFYLKEGKKGRTTVQVIHEIAEPIAEKLGLSIWDIKFLKEGSQWYLRVFIDKDGGISIDDCEAMSRALDEPLDELDPISQSYCLEVCSPGIERELVTDEHFECFKGHTVRLKLIRPNETGKREFIGELLEIENEEVVLKMEEEINKFKRKEIANVKLADDLIDNN